MTSFRATSVTALIVNTRSETESSTSQGNMLSHKHNA
jgi:hypothetical protein